MAVIPGYQWFFISRFQNQRHYSFQAILTLAYGRREPEYSFYSFFEFTSYLEYCFESSDTERMEQIQTNMQWLHAALNHEGFDILVNNLVAPVVTFSLLEPEMTQPFCDELALWGCWLSYQGDYLRQRYWIQIALLGNPLPMSS